MNHTTSLHIVETKAGSYHLPAVFPSVDARHINYWVDHEVAKMLLADTGLKPVHFPGSKALVSLVLLRYNELNNPPAYNEVTIAVLVRLTDSSSTLTNIVQLLKGNQEKMDIGAYILNMPVTAALANEGGREVWGLPKFEAKIAVEMENAGYNYSVTDKTTGELIVSVKCTYSAGLGVAVPDFLFFSNKNKNLLRTRINSEATYKVTISGAVEVQVGTAEHEMVQSIKLLKLDTLKPFSFLSADNFYLRLDEGEIVTVD